MFGYCLLPIPYHLFYSLSHIPLPRPIPYRPLPQVLPIAYPLFPSIAYSLFPSLSHPSEKVYILYIYIYIMCIFLVGAAGIYEFNYYAIPIGG